MYILFQQKKKINSNVNVQYCWFCKFMYICNPVTFLIFLFFLQIWLTFFTIFVFTVHVKNQKLKLINILMQLLLSFFHTDWKLVYQNITGRRETKKHIRQSTRLQENITSYQDFLLLFCEIWLYLTTFQMQMIKFQWATSNTTRLEQFIPPGDHTGTARFNQAEIKEHELFSYHTLWNCCKN